MMIVFGVVDEDTIQFGYTWLTDIHNMYRDLTKVRSRTIARKPSQAYTGRKDDCIYT